MDTRMTSLRRPGIIVTWPPACGRHRAMFGDGTSLNENGGLGRAPPAGAADAALSPRDRASAPASAVAPSPAVRARRWMCLMPSMIGPPLLPWRLLPQIGVITESPQLCAPGHSRRRTMLSTGRGLRHGAAD